MTPFNCGIGPSHPKMLCSRLNRSLGIFFGKRKTKTNVRPEVFSSRLGSLLTLRPFVRRVKVSKI